MVAINRVTNEMGTGTMNLRAGLMGLACMAAMACMGAQPKVAVSGDCELGKAEAGRYALKLNGESGSGTLVLNYTGNGLDLSEFSHIAVDAKNKTAGRVEVRFKAASNPADPLRQIDCRYFLEAGKKRELSMLIFRDRLPESSPWVKYFSETKALPGYQKKWIYLDADQVRQVELTLYWSGLKGDGHVVTFSAPKGVGEFMIGKTTPDDLPQPLVDEAGQLVGEQWEGKVNDLSELPADGKKDLSKYASNKPLPGYSRYGGWLNGPRFEATGRFYTKKVDGKWWFVDPDGYLFWSLGVTCVGFGEPTRIAGREQFFPPPSTDKDPRLWKADDRELEEGDVVFNYVYSNLKHKYGESWVADHTTVCIGRMLEWGLNTSGAWPIQSVLEQQRVPYTLIIHPGEQRIGVFHKVPDPFSDEFKQSLHANLKALGEKHAGDPWNVGIFIDNELHWSNDHRLTLQLIDQDSSVPAKRGMIACLKTKYANIKALNKAWGTDFSSFYAIRNPGGKIKGKDAFWADMTACLDHHAEAYFSQCAAAVKKYLPGTLYLGCRFHDAVFGEKNPVVQRAASRHCDVVSFNIYKISAGGFNPPMEVDRPWIIGEFDYGTATHGVWGVAMIPAMDLDHQAELYEAYVGEVLDHPNFIGAHWFQWADHITTGRYDGENYRIGFVSIVDRPYTALVDSVKKMAQGMYQQRSGKAVPFAGRAVSETR